MSNENEREELRALAGEATPGPWFAEGPWSGFFHDGTETVGTVYPDENAMDDRHAATAAYIAAASPDRITTLLDDLDAAERSMTVAHAAERAYRARAERAEAQVAAVLAACDDADRHGITDTGGGRWVRVADVRAALGADAPTEPGADEAGEDQ